MKEKKKYYYLMNKSDHKAIGDKYILKYIETGGFSISACIRMTIIFITLIIDGLLFLLRDDLMLISLQGQVRWIATIFLCLLNVLVIYSGKFFYVNKNIYKMRKNRNEIVDLTEAEFYKCRCDFEKCEKKSDNEFIATVRADGEEISLNITQIVYKKMKKIYDSAEIAIFLYCLNEEICVYDVMQFKIYERLISKKRFFRKRIKKLKKLK